MANTTDHQSTVTWEALTAVRAALDIPRGATTGDEAIRAGIMENRVRHTLVMLETVLDSPSPDIEWSVAYLRDRLAEHPAEGYKTWDERITELGIGS